jgi:pilus assembly protein Flp/PilA
MRTFVRFALRFLKDEEGPTAVEYSVMLAMIILLCIVVIRQVGTTTSQSFSAANSAFS